MRSQHEIDQEQRQREDDDAGVAGQNLLVGQVRPFVVNPGRQVLREDFFHRRLRLSRGIARCRTAVDIGCKEAVITVGAFRSRRRIHLQQRRKRDHLTRCGANLQAADIFRMGAELRIRLHTHAVCPPEGVEVVDIERTQIDLQRLEDVADRNAQLLGLGAIEIGEELRHVDLEAGEDARQLRRLVCLGDHGFRRFVKRLVAVTGAVLDLQLEAARLAETVDRRRREHGDEGILNARIFLVQLHGDGAAGQFRRLALFEVIENREDDAGVGADGEAVDRQAREGDGVADAGRFHGDIAHPLDDAFRPVECRAIRKLGKADQVLLVLRRHEAARNGREHAVGCSHQRHIDQHHQALARHQPAHGLAIAVRGGAEGAVEAAEEPAENPVHEAGQPVFRCTVFLQQQCRESG
ncbi:hypothetical protein D3C86_1195940 [compost metagenome]